MQTQCPHCATVFPIESEQFLHAQGQVRCGVCDREFDAIDYLRREPPPDLAPPRLDPEWAARQGDLFASPEPRVEETPAFVQPAAGAAPAVMAERAWWASAAALALLLLFQIILGERHQLGTDARWRGAYQTLCGVLRCELPAWREPQRLVLTARDVAPHPSSEGALLVSATLRNDARWAQALPVVELTLADIDGQAVAMRRFRPDEYHGEPGSLIAPGQSTTVRLEIADPGKRALAFAFEFR